MGCCNSNKLNEGGVKEKETGCTEITENHEGIEEMILKSFPGAMCSRRFVNQLNQYLESQGFTPKNTQFSEGMCCDELNEPELDLMSSYWGVRFVYGGLGGYCHGGKTGLGAVLHHVPD